MAILVYRNIPGRIDPNFHAYISFVSSHPTKKTARLKSPDSTSEVCEKQFSTDFLLLNQWKIPLFFLILNGISTFFPYL